MVEVGGRQRHPARSAGAGGAGLDMLRVRRGKPRTTDPGFSDQVSRNKVLARKKQRKPRIGSGSLSSATGRTGPFVRVWGDAASAQLPRMRTTVLDLLQL